MYRKIGANQSAITLRPPPGTRFSIFGADCELQYADAQQGELFEWLDAWLKMYVKPLARRAEIPVPAETKPALLEETSESNSEITPAADPTPTLESTEPTVVREPSSPSELNELMSLLDTLIKSDGMAEVVRRLKLNATETNDGIKGDDNG